MDWSLLDTFVRTGLVGECVRTGLVGECVRTGLVCDCVRTGVWVCEEWCVTVWGLVVECVRNGVWLNEDWSVSVWVLVCECALQLRSAELYTWPNLQFCVIWQNVRVHGNQTGAPTIPWVTSTLTFCLIWLLAWWGLAGPKNHVWGFGTHHINWLPRNSQASLGLVYLFTPCRRGRGEGEGKSLKWAPDTIHADKGQCGGILSLNWEICWLADLNIMGWNL